MRIGGWSSDVCSSDLGAAPVFGRLIVRQFQPVPTSNTAPVLHGIADGGGPIIPGLTNTPTCRTLLFHCLANEREPFAILLPATIGISQQQRYLRTELGRASCTKKGGHEVSILG